MLNNSQNIRDLQIPPSNRLEKLKGRLKEFYSIRINDQRRIIFKWDKGNATDVAIVDYHYKRKQVKRIKNIHPGEILNEEFLLPLGLSAYKLSKDVGIPQTRVSEIIKGNRRITADTALRLSRYFGNTAKFWLGLQDDFDIEQEELLKAKEFDSIEHYQSNAA